MDGGAAFLVGSKMMKSLPDWIFSFSSRQLSTSCPQCPPPFADSWPLKFTDFFFPRSADLQCFKATDVRKIRDVHITRRF